MKEEEWLASNMLAILRLLEPRLSDRKLRLLQVACCRRIWELIPEESWRELVTVSERYADKEATDRMRLAALNSLRKTQDSGEFLTGLIYINEEKQDFITQLNMMDAPLATVTQEQVQPSEADLAKIMAELM